jgi:enediyne biosynthesis protein E4
MKPERPEDFEEITHDDAAVGRGVRYSVLLLVAAGAIGGGWWLLAGRKAPPPSHVTSIAAPQAVRTKASPPVVAFTDIGAAAGITFRHENGAYGEKLLPETMGAGVALFDMDGDGDADILFINSSHWPWKKPDGAGAAPPGAVLYRNDGGGKFTDVTAGSGFEAPFYGMGVAVGDYDNDGLTDVLVTGVGGARLFHNEGGGKFKDVTAAAGVGGDASDWSTAAAFLDYDNDGKLDLFVGNYVRWSREIDAQVGYKIDGVTRAYGPPMNFQGSFPHLYHNEGGGRFSDVSATSGVQATNRSTGTPLAKTLGVAPADLNGDGYIDLVVANDTVQNLVFTNRHDGTFAEVGALTGIAFDSNGNSRGAMGVDAARFTPDGKFAVGIGNFANEMTAFYVAHEDPMQFTDDAISWGVGPASRLPLKFGLFFFDYDLDGRLDLLTADGHLEETIGKIQASQSYRQAAQLFWNAGDDGLTPVDPSRAPGGLFTPVVGRGSAYADLDGDGDLDVVLTQCGDKPLVLRNDQKLGRHFVRLKLVGTRSNRDAIGAWVKLTSKSGVQWRQVMPSRSYLSASELPVTFGLGDATAVEGVEIVWPLGAKQRLDKVDIDKLTVVEEPR